LLFSARQAANGNEPPLFLERIEIEFSQARLSEEVVAGNFAPNQREGPFRFSEFVKGMAGTTRLELATSAVTGQRSNQLNYVPNCAAAPVTNPPVVHRYFPAQKRRLSRKSRLPDDAQDGGQCRARTCDLLLVRQAL
jgi:hypothetical protein